MRKVYANQSARNEGRTAERIDRAISVIFPRWGLKRVAARRAAQMLRSTEYRGADQTRLRSDWIAWSTEGTPDAWELDLLRERSRDLNRNDPVASGATETMGINVVGAGLKPQSHLRAKYLDISDDKAKELQRQAEMAWQTWSPFADAANRLNFDEIQFLALRKIIEDGEILALPAWAEEPWRPFGRCVELIEAHRLEPGGSGLLNGIKIGPRGQPLSYHIRKAKFKDGTQQDEYVDVPARDSKGRPKVLHVFKTNRPGQQRGVPFFAPALTLFKDIADYLEAEVVAARVAACLAVFITKADAMGYAAAASSESETGGARLQTIEPAMVSYLNPGETIGVVDPKRPGQEFGPFLEGVLRLIGVALGLPYELLVKDFSKTNYSSARAALLEGRRMFTTWRSWFARRFCQPIWELVLEEAFLRDKFDAADFYSLRAEYCRAQWVGGAWGWVDPKKEVESSKLAVEFGLSTLAEEAAAQGRDWEETLEQRAREETKIKELGLEIKEVNRRGGSKDADTE